MPPIRQAELSRQPWGGGSVSLLPTAAWAQEAAWALGSRRKSEEMPVWMFRWPQRLSEAFELTHLLASGLHPRGPEPTEGVKGGKKERTGGP